VRGFLILTAGVLVAIGAGVGITSATNQPLRPPTVVACRTNAGMSICTLTYTLPKILPFRHVPS